MMILWCVLGSAYATTMAEWLFDDSDGGFAAETGLQWQWGLDAVHGWGWSTRLEGLYLNDAQDRLIVPPLDLSDSTRPVFGLRHSYNIDQTGDGDLGWVEALVDGTWSTIEPVYGYPATGGFAGSNEPDHWDWFDLSTLGDNPSLRLVFHSDPAVRRTGWFVRSIALEDGDPVPPQFQSVSTLNDTTDILGPYEVTANIVDDMAIDFAEIFWESNNGETGSSPLLNLAGNEYSGSIDGQLPGTVIEWWLKASDGINEVRWPSEERNRFSVRLPAPSELSTTETLPFGRIASTNINIEWDPPPTTYPMAGYLVERDGVQIATPTENHTNINLVDGVQTITVRGIFNVGGDEHTGDASEPLELDVSLPTLTSLTPNNAWPDDDLRVVIEGDNLYMDATDTVLEVGAHIEVQSFEVLDAHRARALIHVLSDAVPGPHPVQLQIGEMVVTSGIDFIIQNDADRPIVLGAHPTSVRQGAHTTLFIDLSAPESTSKPPPTVHLGDGIIVESVVRRGSGLDVRVSVAYDAPLGEHIIEIDEGDRLITGATLEVRDTPKVPERNCSTQGGQETSTIWPWLLGIALSSRRRNVHDYRRASRVNKPH